MSEVFEYLDAVNNYWDAEKQGKVIEMGQHLYRINSSKKDLEALIDLPQKPKRKNRFGWVLAITGLILPLLSGTVSAHQEYDLSETCVENIETFSENYLNNLDDYDYLNLERKDNLEQLGFEFVYSQSNIIHTKEEIDFDNRHIKYGLMTLADIDNPIFGELNSESEIFIAKHIENEVERTNVPIAECQNKEVHYNSPVVGIAPIGLAIGLGGLIGTRLRK